MQNACWYYLSYPLIVSCYNVYLFQTIKQSTKDNQSYKQYSNATEGMGRDDQSESSSPHQTSLVGALLPSMQGVNDHVT